MHRRALLSSCGSLLVVGCLGSRTESREPTGDATTESTNETTTERRTTTTTSTSHATCAVRGAVDLTDDVLGARGCDADSVSVTLGFSRNDFCHAYLLLDAKQGSGDAVELSESDVTGLSELQNAVAFLGPNATNVRVRTSKRRADEILDYLDSLAGEYPSTTQFAFDGRTFALLVVQEDCVVTTETTER